MSEPLIKEHANYRIQISLVPKHLAICARCQLSKLAEGQWEIIGYGLISGGCSSWTYEQSDYFRFESLDDIDNHAAIMKIAHIEGMALLGYTHVPS